MLVTKILKYNPYGPDDSRRYEYVCDLLAGKNDPPSLAVGKFDMAGRTVYAPESRRALECIASALATSFETLSELNEIQFDFKKRAKKQLFDSKGSDSVRSAFIDAFAEDDLHSSHDELQSQFEYILDHASKYPEAVYVSHTFRMKLLQLYVQYKDRLFTDPEVIRNAVPVDKHIFEFGETIEI